MHEKNQKNYKIFQSQMNNPVKKNSQCFSQTNLSDKQDPDKSIKNLFIDQKMLFTLDIGEENNVNQIDLNQINNENDHYDIYDEQIKIKKQQQTDYSFPLDLGQFGLQTMTPDLSELQNHQNQDLYYDDSNNLNNYEVGEMQQFEKQIQK